MSEPTVAAAGIEFTGDRRVDGPAEAVVITDHALYQVRLQHANGRLLGGAGLFTDAAAGTGVTVHHRHEHGVFAEPARVMFDGDSLALYGAFAETDFAAQSLPGQTVLDIDNRQSHAGVVDLFQGGIECPGGAGGDTGDVGAHVTGYFAGDEIGRSDRDAGIRGRQFQGVIGAGVHTLAALDAARIEIRFVARPRRANGKRCCPRLLIQQVRPDQTAGGRQGRPLGDPGKKVTARDRCQLGHGSSLRRARHARHDAPALRPCRP